MIDREKVIKGLEICSDCGFCETIRKYDLRCPYRNDDGKGCDRSQLLMDALAILTEQKHGETFTVIDTKTGKEADEYNIALYEDWAKDLCYCDMEGWAIENDGTLLLVDECGRFEYADRERFKVVWDA